MKISTKGRYALRFLLDLAEHQNDGFIALKDVAVRQKISKKYLEQIIPILNKSQLLYANRGYQGGYKLVKPANQYTVGEILRLTEVISDYLDNITLQDILNNRSEGSDNYVI